LQIDYSGDVPIYLQIAEQIEDGILSGAFAEEGQIPSTTEISVTYQINPATVLKGVTLLADRNILYKKRGIGMFVKEGAREIIEDRRRQAFYDAYIATLIREAQKLNITKQQIIEMIERG
jgi:DNA-binding transcriptional regulator YhcF (GntR family)